MLKLAESGVVVCNGSLENNVSTGKWNANVNCIHCLNLGREVRRLHQELSLANEIIKILEKDIDLIQRHANGRMTRDHTSMNVDWCNLNWNIRSNEWQMAKVNMKWKNNRRNDTGKPQQITTIVNQFAVLSDVASDCDRQKQLEGINKKELEIERK